MARRAPLPLAVTMGEPAGIGGEIALAAWSVRYDRGLPPFFLIDSPLRMKALADHLGWRLPIEVIDRPEDAAEAFDQALPILPLEMAVEATPGRPDPKNGQAVLDSIRQAVMLTREGRAAAVVTNPIQKSTLYESGFAFPGHTEFLAELSGTNIRPVMMLVCSELRVVPVTIHVPLREAPALLTREAIIHCAVVTADALKRDFSLTPPRLSVTGLNPHAGEKGGLGTEEDEIIRPAVDELRAMGLAVDGPHPADTMFHERARAQYDAAICMYHDQALIPIKTLDFDRGVNTTLGLPFVRTSPDHGTALSIAGKGIASAESFIAALELADRTAAQRARRAAVANDLG